MVALEFKCSYADRAETITLELHEVRGDWFKFTLHASQAGCCARAPFLALREHLESFRDELEQHEAHLEIENKALVLNDYTCQNKIIVGPLSEHQGILFLDLRLSFPVMPDEEDWGLGRPDSFADRYHKMRREIRDYPNPLNLSLNSGKYPASTIKWLMKHGEEIQQFVHDSQKDQELSPGARIQFSGLQWGRSQVPKVIGQLKEILACNEHGVDGSS